MDTGYDIIGDIHGHGSALIALLEHLGYRKCKTGFAHPVRKVVFLGDFIDGGEALREHQLVLDTVIPMIRNGHALAVMGNHEFNALAFHTEFGGAPLRPHTDKNLKQHQAFLNEYEADPIAKAEVLAFFYELPLWLDLDGLRVIHACWHPEHLRTARQLLPNDRLHPGILREAAAEGSALFVAIETLLKGYEAPLPKKVWFKDKGGHIRNAVRVGWWNREARLLGEVVQPPDTDIKHAAQQPIPDDIPRYPADEPPCFIGHYWMTGRPVPLTSNVACLDYSVAKGGKLVAYRWRGEQVLDADHFSYL